MPEVATISAQPLLAWVSSISSVCLIEVNSALASSEFSSLHS